MPGSKRSNEQEEALLHALGSNGAPAFPRQDCTFEMDFKTLNLRMQGVALFFNRAIISLKEATNHNSLYTQQSPRPSCSYTFLCRCSECPFRLVAAEGRSKTNTVTHRIVESIAHSCSVEQHSTWCTISEELLGLLLAKDQDWLHSSRIREIRSMEYKTEELRFHLELKYGIQSSAPDYRPILRRVLENLDTTIVSQDPNPFVAPGRRSALVPSPTTVMFGTSLDQDFGDAQSQSASSFLPTKAQLQLPPARCDGTLQHEKSVSGAKHRRRDSLKRKFHCVNEIKTKDDNTGTIADTTSTSGPSYRDLVRQYQELMSKGVCVDVYFGHTLESTKRAIYKTLRELTGSFILDKINDSSTELDQKEYKKSLRDLSRFREQECLERSREIEQDYAEQRLAEYMPRSRKKTRHESTMKRLIVAPIKFGGPSRRTLRNTRLERCDCSLCKKHTETKEQDRYKIQMPIPRVQKFDLHSALVCEALTDDQPRHSRRTKEASEKIATSIAELSSMKNSIAFIEEFESSN